MKYIRPKLDNNIKEVLLEVLKSNDISKKTKEQIVRAFMLPKYLLTTGKINIDDFNPKL